MPGGDLHTDICIAGAGPAGLAAALALSKKGFPFVLADKDSFPRDKICGDGFGGKGLAALKRIDPESWQAFHESGTGFPSFGAKFVSPNLKETVLGFSREQLQHPPGYVVRRKDLDGFLLQRVKDLQYGTVLESNRILSAAQAANGITLATAAGGTIRCKLLLLATGAHSRAFAGICPHTAGSDGTGLGIRAYYGNIAGFGAENAIEIHFLKELLPCYLWIFPLGNGIANVGLALPADRISKKKIVLKELLNELLEKYPSLRERFARASLLVPPQAQPLAFYNGKIPVSGDRFLCLGDAARLTDPFTGEGIGNAMVSGMAAAEVAAKAVGSGDFSLNALKEYDRLLYSKLDKDLELGLRLRDLARNSRLINLVVGKASKSQKVRDALRDVLFGMNTMQELSQPMFYAKLLLGID